MKFYLASQDDFSKIQAFYWNLIEKMKPFPYLPAWGKELHPSNELLLRYIDQQQLYILTEQEKICAALALNSSANEEYKEVPWHVSCTEEEVLIVHILAVDPSMQGKGIGRSVMERAIALARQSGKKAIRLDTSDTNDPADHLYRSLGFVYIETKHIFYKHTGFLAFKMYELAL